MVVKRIRMMDFFIGGNFDAKILICCKTNEKKVKINVNTWKIHTFANQIKSVKYEYCY